MTSIDGRPVPDLLGPSIVVAIPTLRRNEHLRALLPLLVAQAADLEATSTSAVRVLVVDNDPSGGAEAMVRETRTALVETRSAPSAWSALDYLRQPAPGLAAVRNAALEAAGERLLVFMDDDGRPDEGWLTHLVATWRRSGAAAVAGRVVERYEREPPRWVVAGEFFRRFSMPTLTEVTVAPTGNLLLDMEVVRRLGLTFDERFGSTGGEDTLFTSQLTARGGRIVWCDESRVIDLVPESRTTRQWVLARQRSQGILAVRVADALAVDTGRLAAQRVAYLGRGSARLAYGLGRAAYGTLREDLAANAKGLKTAHRGVGMLLAAVTPPSRPGP
ncbi:MAG: glycosyltransferase [Lapillicoccus sp.]